MIALFDVISRKFTIEHDVPPGISGGSISAKLNRHDQIIPLNNVKFGYFIIRNGYESDRGEWPPENVFYDSTDQDIIETIELEWDAGDQVSVFVWLIDNTKQRHEASITFSVPLPPESPYPSWVWSDGAWQPPIPYPDDDQFYNWDEDNQQWEVVIPEEV